MTSIANVRGFILSSLLLAGCSTPEVVEITTSPIDKPELVLPQAQELNLRDVTWIVITPENIDEVWKELQDTGTTVVLFALTDQGYENVSLNLNDIRSYIQQQQAIIAAYNRYYRDVETTIDTYNETL